MVLVIYCFLISHFPPISPHPVLIILKYHSLLALTMVPNHTLHIPHNLPIPPRTLLRHLRYAAPFLKNAGGLAVQNEGDGEEAFDPFDQLIAAVRFERIWGMLVSGYCEKGGKREREEGNEKGKGTFDAVAGRHFGLFFSVLVLSSSQVPFKSQAD